MKNPDWNRRELILALDLYFNLSYGQMDGNNPKVKALSNLLSIMNESDGFSRSVGSVSLKFANFKRIDPAFTGSGMTGGSKLEEEIWKDYYGSRDELRRSADAIKKEILDDRKQLFIIWLEQNGKPDGTLYQRRTIQVYASQVENTIFREYAIDRNGASLYEITNPEELADINELLSTGEDNKRRRDLRSAFQSYIRFILYIRGNVVNGNPAEMNEAGECRTEGGRKVYISYKAERNPGLRKKAIANQGTTCKACNFNFGRFYGKWGDGFIEVHHLLPLGDGQTGERLTDSAKDLITLCSNCHRMVHRKRGITLTLEELKQKINDAVVNGRKK